MPPKRPQRRRPYERPSARCEHTDRSTSDRSGGASELVFLDSGNGGDQAGTCNPFVNLFASSSTASGSEESGTDMQSVVFDLPQSILHCVDDDMSVHVSPELCAKIWRGEFINLALLLKKDVSSSKGSNITLNEQGLLEVVPKPNKQITNIREWTDAFLVYIAIYIKKHPSKAGELLQYMATIREAEGRNSSSLAWKSYDENFRFRQAVSPMSWAKINPDLWLKTMTVTLLQPNLSTKTGSYRQSMLNQQKKVCFDFNSVRGCRFSNCRYAHKCIICKGDHNQIKCNQSSQNSNFRK